MDYKELEFHAEQGFAFRSSLTITANGVPTVLTDRTFTGRVRAFGGGPIILDLNLTIADQSQFPGRVDVLVTPDLMKGIELDRSSPEFRFETKFIFDIGCTYANQPGLPEKVAGGYFYIRPSAL